MIKPARSTPRPRRLQYWGSVVLRIVLLISVWQGPIPWFHCHGSLAAANEVQPWLVKHLRSHHATFSLFADIDFGWHCHVDLPTSASEDKPNESPKPRVVISSSETLTPVSVSGDIPPSSRFIRLPTKTLGISPPGLTTAGVNQHFYDSFAESLSLPLRFCVALI